MGTNQRFLDIGISTVFVFLVFSVSYWTSLTEKSSTLEAFEFLLIPDTKDRYQHGRRYHLGKKSTDSFLRIYRIASPFLWLSLLGFFIVVYGMILRCLYHSFYTVTLIYFFSICLPLLLTTLVAYGVMIIFVTTWFVLVVVITAFLILQVKELDKMISCKFTGESIRKPMEMREQKALKVLIPLNDFCRQFRQINQVLDSSISGALLGSFSGLYFLPYFMIFADTLTIRMILFLLSLTVFCFCASFSICNDRLRNQVG